MSKNSHITRQPRRTTHKEHSEHYKKVYHPYLPALLIFFLSGFIFVSSSLAKNHVLGYATEISSSGLLENTNKTRQSSELGQLKNEPKLSAAAQKKADDIASKNYWSHITPEGKQPWDFIEQTGYSYSYASENLAYGFATSDKTVKGWLSSPEHAEAMLDSKVTDVGFGIADSPDFQGNGPQTIVVAMYAQPAVSAPASLGSSTKYTPASGANITYAQTFFSNVPPWLNLIVGVIIGLAVMYLLSHHSFHLHRALRKGEKFIIRHPALDLTVISIIVLGVVVSRSAGIIH